MKTEPLPQPQSLPKSSCSCLFSSKPTANPSQRLIALPHNPLFARSPAVPTSHLVPRLQPPRKTFLQKTMATTSYAAPSGAASAGATKRLLAELRDYARDPSGTPFLSRLAPVSDDSLFTWEAVMSGVPGSAYEGKPPPLFPPLDGNGGRERSKTDRADPARQTAAGSSASSSPRTTRTTRPA